MVAQKQNFVNAVAQTAGISLQNVVGSVTKPGAISEYASNCAANADMICKIAEKVEPQGAEAKSHNSVSLDVQGPSIGWSAVGSGAILALTAVNPMLGAGAAVIGAGIEAVNFARSAASATFSTGHAGVKGSMPAGGELTLAAADKKSFAESHGAEPYVDVLGESWDGQSGQKVAAAKPTAPVGNHLDQRLAAATQEVSKKYDKDQIHTDIRYMLDKEMKNYAWAQNKLEMLGAGPDDVVGMDMKKINETLDITAPKETPKPFRGLAAPSLG